MDLSLDLLDRLRFENIEKRRQLCSDVVKSRKRKLSELYFLSRSPLLPITDEIIASEDDYLMAFLEKNDLESGHVFEESSLPSTIYTNKPVKIDAVEVDNVLAHQRAQTHRLSPQDQVRQLKHLEQDQRNRQPLQNTVQQLVSPTAVHTLTSRTPPITMPSPVERMTTRVSSGAIRHKSVNELLGTTPKLTPRRVANASSIEPELVTNTKSTQHFMTPEDLPVRPGVSLVKIYYSIQASPLSSLVPLSHKSLTTENFLTSYMESKLLKTFARVDELKRDGKWSLRQPQRFRPPKRAKTHWDYLLGEMLVTAEDSANKQKNKVARCSNIASWIRDYWTFGKDLCVKTRPPRILSDEELSERMSRSDMPDSKENESNGETENDLAPSDYQTQHYSSIDPNKDDLFRDPIEDLPIVSIGRFSMIASDITPERIQQWKQRHSEADAQDVSAIRELHPVPDSENNTRKPLFISESARRGVYIKAPPPPSLKYVEFGVPTIWLPQDDSNLIKLASEFMYNWDVVSANMTLRQSSGFNSNIERRTAWECFERWMQLEPNFQTTDLRGPYARAAQVWLEATSRAQMVTKRRMVPMGIGPDNFQRGQRRLRWGGMFEAIRKSIRKRENARRFGNTR
ncbi:hypothetical protein V1512DRAFT_257066 [Lipomyces arxii]|uniref:uncharacterized protein n=1 Tax=Lipomyces arxii TaxID=56418 RepID=UPI0034CFBDD1